MSNTVLDALRTYTATNIFMILPLGITRADIMKVGFKNAYIKDEVRGIEYERGIYLLFRPRDIEPFENFLIKERKRKAIIDEYDYPKGYTMLVYQYDPKWTEDVRKIMSGKYSEVSYEFKKLFPKTAKIEILQATQEVLTNHHAIFSKSATFADYWKEELGLEFEDGDEIWPFYAEREIFKQVDLDKL